MKHVFRRYVIFGKYLGCKANLALQSLQDEEVDSSLSVFLRRTNVHIPATVRDLAMASIDNTIKVLKVSDVEEDLTCAICKENPKEKLLNCGHSFCKTCLKAGKAGNGAITCGLCRRTTNVPGNDVEKLNTDFTAQNMEDKIQMKSLSIRDTHEEECGECSEGGAPAVAFCKDCNNPICKSCMEDHSKKKRLLSHMIVDLSERETKELQIFVKTMDGKTLTIRVAGSDDSVDNLKKIVCERTGVPVSEMRLICRGRQLGEGKLSDYGVEKNCTLQLVLRLRGGEDDYGC
ncbi:uncharacterized protein [Apostichopus japonicus]|uniref:uncharacterized protein n=1 Tax=Stichopus japonicus TaxID=307972 RepID=UPI003AB89E9A